MNKYYLKGDEDLNSQRLKGLIVGIDGNQITLAKAMGLSLSRLNAKINETSGAEFTQSEIAFIKRRYGLSDSETADIFFNPDLS